MTNIQIFQNPEFGQVRTTTYNGEIAFVAKDIMERLGYADLSNIGKAIEHVPEEWKGRESIPTPGGAQEMAVLTEQGLYFFLARSNKPLALPFQKWIAGEVVPSIRKTGGYSTTHLTGNELVLAAMQHLQSELGKEQQLRIAAETQIETDKPKVLFSEAVATSKTEILVGELAKILHQNGVSVGQNRLFAKLRAEGYLCKTGSTRNMPTQRSVDLGLFRIKETTITHSDGHITISKTPKVTGKGQIYFVNKFITWHQMYTEPLHPEAGGALTIHDELGNDVRIA